MWFAFKNVSLSYWKQQSFDASGIGVLWFAFKNVSLSYWKQHTIGKAKAPCVVICFQKCIFVVLETTVSWFIYTSRPLWFAFKNVSLSYWKQHWFIRDGETFCCDLLSKMYLCRIGNNFNRFWFSYTLLWFAFKNVSLSYWKQHILRLQAFQNGCDLLSKMYLCRIGNNLSILILASLLVVICFQKCIFVVLETTSIFNILRINKLWFAFKNVSLSYWKQQKNQNNTDK